ncbi:MAG: FAD-binding protein [Planctomycetaceae bacterium]|nr:FAD-binding protein [Planctomycetaceae bacterium]
MDDLQQRIAEDLSGVFEGELRFDEITRQAYATDASVYHLLPLGVACPRHEQDVVTLTRYAAENYLPLIPRGAGTGLAGGAIGHGLVIDFSRHMHAIESIDESTVRVQPGVVREQLNRRLREYGRYFAPDPSNSRVTTIGGMIGVDAAGSHAVRVGSTRDHVQQMRLVLASGTLLDVGMEPLRQPFPQNAPEDDPERIRHHLVHRLAHLLQSHAELIQTRQPPLLRNCAGYHVRTLLQRDEVNLPRLIVGSEGTLAICTSATLHTSPLPANRGAVLLLFGTLEAAIRSVQGITEQQPSACDLLDRRLLSLAREADERFAQLIPASAEAALLVEQTGYSQRQTKDRLQSCIAQARESDSSVLVAGETYRPEEVDLLWSLPYRIVPLLTSLGGATRPTPIVEDLAIPPECLRDFLVKAQRVFQKHWVTASLYAHASSGQIHFRPFLRWPSTADGAAIEGLARELYEVVFAFGGTISGEHGDGLSRTSFLRSQYGPLYSVFKQIKDLFDPHNLLNPGKIISDDPHLTIKHFRPQPSAAALSVEPQIVPLQMVWDSPTLQEAVSRCNGCGVCRTQSRHERMCPFFHLDPAEEASPRAKANLLRGVVTGSVDPRELSSEQARLVADTCFNCRQCVVECPAQVDIPAFVQEIRAGYVDANGLSRTDWALSRAHSFGRLGTAFAPLANWALNNSGVRWLLERFIGIARQRRLPQFARRTFLNSVRHTLSDRRRITEGKKPVVLFVDHFVNFHDPELGFALVAVLEHHGINVYVPQEQTASGMAMLTAGDLEAARELAQINLRTLGELAREGMTILCTEPTSVVCLKQDYPRLLAHPDMESLVAQVTEAGAFLEQLRQRDELKTDFIPLDLRAAYHTPCHLRSLQQGTPLANLLELIPGLDLQRIEKGCSGMAGAFGLTAHNFDASLQIGAALMAEMQRPDLQIGTTECSGCKLQMEQQTTTPTLHPLKLLALAYGYLPEIRQRMLPNRRMLTVRS